MIQLHRQIARVTASMIIPTFVNKLSIISVITKLLPLSPFLSLQPNVIAYRRIWMLLSQTEHTEKIKNT